MHEVRYVWKHERVFVMCAPNAVLDHIHNSLMASLRAIEGGKGLLDGVSIAPFGQSSTVERSLSLASQHLDESFHSDDSGVADATFDALGFRRPSDNKSEAALKLTSILSKHSSS